MPALGHIRFLRRLAAGCRAPAVAVAFVILAAGPRCTEEVEPDLAACNEAHECPESYNCLDGLCYPIANRVGVACTEDGDCPAGVCLDEAHVCVGCIKHTDCVSRLCQTQTHICMGCKADYQCLSGSCDEQTGLCAENSTNRETEGN